MEWITKYDHRQLYFLKFGDELSTLQVGRVKFLLHVLQLSLKLVLNLLLLLNLIVQLQQSFILQ